MFITGILPVTIDELSSAFNIGTLLTLNPRFESMLGFTPAEVDQLLDDVYRDYEILRQRERTTHQKRPSPPAPLDFPLRRRRAKQDKACVRLRRPKMSEGGFAENKRKQEKIRENSPEP